MNRFYSIKIKRAYSIIKYIIIILIVNVKFDSGFIEYDKIYNISAECHRCFNISDIFRTQVHWAIFRYR